MTLNGKDKIAKMLDGITVLNGQLWGGSMTNLMCLTCCLFLVLFFVDMFRWEIKSFLNQNGWWNANLVFVDSWRCTD